jgi:hypothetical protein
VQGVRKAVAEAIRWKLKWLRETRRHVRILKEEKTRCSVKLTEEMMKREQRELVLLRRIKQVLNEQKN